MVLSKIIFGMVVVVAVEYTPKLRSLYSGVYIIKAWVQFWADFITAQAR